MASRRPLVGGNWKCNGSVTSIKELIAAYNAANTLETSKVDVVIAPAAIHIPLVKEAMRSDFKVAAQNAYTESGAFTGEVSVEILRDYGIEWVILGHSERRHVFGEGDKLIGAKTAKALSAGLGVIACVGETLAEREANKTFDVVFAQLKAFAENVKQWNEKFVIAYEPVWAIGTGKTATSAQAQEVHAAIRKWLQENVSAEAANTRILYGGSVRPDNSDELYQQKDVDGFLVGGASLKPDFSQIIASTTKPKQV